MRRVTSDLEAYFPREYIRFDKCCVDNAADIKEMQRSELINRKLAKFDEIFEEKDLSDFWKENQFKEIDTLDYRETVLLDSFIPLYELVLLAYYRRKLDKLREIDWKIEEYTLKSKKE